MMEKNQQNHKDHNKLVFQNSQIVNLIRSINCTLGSLGLMDDFRIVKSFKIFITILRKVNSDLGKIIYSQEEELLYYQRRNYIQKKNERVLNANNYKFSHDFNQLVPTIQETQKEKPWGIQKKGNNSKISRAATRNEDEKQLQSKITNQKNQINYTQEENNNRLSIENKDQANDCRQDLNQNPFTAKIIFHSSTPPWSQTNYDSKAEQYK